MFKVEITEIVEVQKPYEREWRRLHDNEPTEEKPQYGYVMAEGTRTVKEERRVLLQQVSELDFVAVLKAVNNIR